MKRQQTAAELLAEALAGAPEMPHSWVQTRAGLGHGVIHAWLHKDRSPRADLLFAAINVCGYRVVLVPMDGG